MGKLLQLLFYIILIPLFCVYKLVRLIFRSFKTKKHEEKTQKEETKKIYKIHKNKYKLPPMSLLDDFEDKNFNQQMEKVIENIKIIENLFATFNINLKVKNVYFGPRFTNYEMNLTLGMKLDDVIMLKSEIAIALAAKEVNIVQAFNRKNSIYIEIPNDKIKSVKLKYTLLDTCEKDSNGLFISIGINNIGEVCNGKHM